jgi:hypothetical protein
MHAGLPHAHAASADRPKRLYTSHEDTVQVHSSNSHVTNFFMIHPAPSTPRRTAEKRPPHGPREASATSPQSRPSTSCDLALVRAASDPTPVSSDKSKEASASTHRGTNAVRVLIELMRRCRAHARATRQSVCTPCTCTRKLPGTPACTTGANSTDLASRGMHLPPIAIGFCRAAGSTRGARCGIYVRVTPESDDCAVRVDKRFTHQM